ncbi:hypothetical protein PJL18_01460 [Paenarthrobacter nicotinovorans]|nr:hypothetical protein [Paenarthrobacter nicotinovorans]
MIVFPLYVQQIIRVTLGKARTDEDFEVIDQILAGDAETVSDLLDMQALVMDQERHQLQHPCQLVFRSALPGARCASRFGEPHLHCRCGAKVLCSLQTSDDGGAQVGRF